MNAFANNPNQNEPAASERELLIARIVDGRAGDSEWTALRSMSAGDPLLWRDLSDAQRDAAMLSEAMAPALAAAERTALPSVVLHSDPLPLRERMARANWRGGLGWLAAAAVTAAWVTGISPWSRPEGALSNGNAAGILPVNTNPDDLLSKYVDVGRQQGRVVAEMPERMVLESRPTADGKGMEVLYLRQLLERAVVTEDAMFRVGQNDAGQRVLLPAGPQAAPKPGL
jgi:hypothetical protein